MGGLHSEQTEQKVQSEQAQDWLGMEVKKKTRFGFFCCPMVSGLRSEQTEQNDQTVQPLASVGLKVKKTN